MLWTSRVQARPPPESPCAISNLVSLWQRTQAGGPDATVKPSAQRALREGPPRCHPGRRPKTCRGREATSHMCTHAHMPWLTSHTCTHALAHLPHVHTRPGSPPTHAHTCTHTLAHLPHVHTRAHMPWLNSHTCTHVHTCPSSPPTRVHTCPGTPPTHAHTCTHALAHLPHMHTRPGSPPTCAYTCTNALAHLPHVHTRPGSPPTHAHMPWLTSHTCTHALAHLPHMHTCVHTHTLLVSDRAEIHTPHHPPFSHHRPQPPMIFRVEISRITTK